MNTSIWKRLLLLAALMALPGTAWATNLWAPTTSAPYLPSNNPNFTAPYVWGADPFTLTTAGTSRGALVTTNGSGNPNDPVAITPLSVPTGDQPVPNWTGSTGFRVVPDPANPSSTDGAVNLPANPNLGVNSGGAANGFMSWMPTTYRVNKALGLAPTYPLVTAQSAVNFGLGDTVDVGMLGNPDNSLIRTQANGAKNYVAGCSFEYDMGSVWLSVTQGAGNTGTWSLDARETTGSRGSAPPDTVLASGSLTSFDSGAWYLMQVWYNYPSNTLSAQLVNAAGSNLLTGTSNIALGSYEPDIQGYGFQVSGGLNGAFSFQPNSGATNFDNFAAVPEPSSFVLAGFAAAGLGAMVWRRRGKQRRPAAA